MGGIQDMIPPYELSFIQRNQQVLDIQTSFVHRSSGHKSVWKYFCIQSIWFYDPDRDQ